MLFSSANQVRMIEGCEFFEKYGVIRMHAEIVLILVILPYNFVLEDLEIYVINTSRCFSLVKYTVIKIDHFSRILGIRTHPETP